MAPSRSSFSLDGFAAITLKELDDRAALLKRIDTKYLVDGPTFGELLGRLAEDHVVLEIDGRRHFGYQSVYFDTPELRCFEDHVRDRAPRFKARTRLYRDSGQCVFEVKLKLDDGETDKRQLEHDPSAPFALSDAARECIRDALSKRALSVPDELEPTLRTTFTRITLAPCAGSGERTTCDLKIVLERVSDGRARITEGAVVVETKSKDGESPTDRLLAEMKIEPLSLSKYRTGIALLDEKASDPDSPREAERWFEVESAG